MLTAATGFGLVTYSLAVKTLSGDAPSRRCGEENDSQKTSTFVWPVRRIALYMALVFVSCVAISVTASVCPEFVFNISFLRKITCADLRYAEVSRKPDGWHRLSSQESTRLLDVKGANLGGVNLAGACASGAFLVNAIMTESNMEKADLRQADLCGSVQQRLPAHGFVGKRQPSRSPLRRR